SRPACQPCDVRSVEDARRPARRVQLAHARRARGLHQMVRFHGGCRDGAWRTIHGAHQGALKPMKTTARRGMRGSLGSTVLRVLGWGKRHGGLARLYARIPFSWRLALRRRVHSAAGMPMPPLPFPTNERRAARTTRVQTPPVSPGVNLLGYARGEFGIAENVRSYA